MASKSSFVFFGLGLVAMLSVGCGGEDGAFDTSPRAQSPSCGNDCPTTCWAEFHALGGGGKEIRVWLFHANEISPSSAVRYGELKLFSDDDTFNPTLTSQVPMTIPSTLEMAWTLPGSFDTGGQGMGSRIMPYGLDEIDCGGL
jgi:hypothetical protein